MASVLAGFGLWDGLHLVAPNKHQLLRLASDFKPLPFAGLREPGLHFPVDLHGLGHGHNVTKGFLNLQ